MKKSPRVLNKEVRKSRAEDAISVDSDTQVPAMRKGEANGWRRTRLQSRPGFLIRRLYQIHVALFAEECAAERITPVQYSVLTSLDQLGTVDQATLSRSVALDRTNVADVVARLEGRNLVKRRPSPQDGRMMLSSITREGCELLNRLEPAARRAHERTIAALPRNERALFLEALAYLVASADQNGSRAASRAL